MKYSHRRVTAAMETFSRLSDDELADEVTRLLADMEPHLFPFSTPDAIQITIEEI